MIVTPLSGHTSPDTAYIADDYPYGFRLRCKIRYWLEYKKQHGYRLVSQTTNPKREGTVWNKPKASIYALVAASMYLDENGHVQWHALTGSERPDRIADFIAKFPDADTTGIRALVKIQIRYTSAKAAGKATHTFNGVPIVPTEDDIERAREELAQWEAVRVSLPNNRPSHSRSGRAVPRAPGRPQADT